MIISKIVSKTQSIKILNDRRIYFDHVKEADNGDEVFYSNRQEVARWVFDKLELIILENNP